MHKSHHVTVLMHHLVFQRSTEGRYLKMTYDNAKEMANHQSLRLSTGIQVFFAHTCSPWERGTNENTNDLLRRDLPKISDLSVYTQDQLDAIAFHHSAKPRKPLGWKSSPSCFCLRAHSTSRRIGLLS